jgi:drug/metabolite transporter (DMT)-like permease
MSARGDEQTRGLALVLLSTLAYGAMPIFAKAAYGAGVTAVTLLAWRFTLATGLFALLAAGHGPAGLRPRDHVRLWGIGAVFVVNAMAYFKGLERLPASTTAVLVYTYPVMVTLLSGFLGFDRFTLRGLVSALMAFSGCAFTAGGVQGGGTGVALVLFSALLYAVYLILGSRFAADLPPAAAASHTAQAAAAICVPWAASQGTVLLPPAPRAWAAVAAIAALSTVVALRALLSGMARIGAVRAAVLSSFEVVVSLVLSALFLGERLGPRQLAGAGLILGAVVLQNLGLLRSFRPS